MPTYNIPRTNQHTMHHLQLATVEDAADTLVSTLSSATTTRATHSGTSINAINRATAALASFESIISQLQPVLSEAAAAATASPQQQQQPLSDAALSTAWADYYYHTQLKNNKAKTTHKQPTKRKNVPPSPPDTVASTLQELLTTIDQRLNLTSSSSSSSTIPSTTVVSIKYNVFICDIVLSDATTSAPMTPYEIALAPPTPTPTLSSFLTRMTGHAVAAMLSFNQMDQEKRGHASPLELLVVWLAAVVVGIIVVLYANQYHLLFRPLQCNTHSHTFTMCTQTECTTIQ